MTKGKYKFASAKELDDLITRYFEAATGKPTAGSRRVKNKTTTLVVKQATKEQLEAPTIAGLALYLGFNSRQEFEHYEACGKFGNRLKRARLRIEELYEKRLHTQYTSGAIFALKNLSRNERPDNKLTDEPVNITMKVEIVESGPPLASSEKEVIL
jgi:hypothetical protein